MTFRDNSIADGWSIPIRITDGWSIPIRITTAWSTGMTGVTRVLAVIWCSLVEVGRRAWETVEVLLNEPVALEPPRPRFRRTPSVVLHQPPRVLPGLRLQAAWASALLAFVPSVAHAQAATVATGIAAFVLAHLTLSMFLAAIPVALSLLGVHLSAKRRQQVALAIHVAAQVAAQVAKDAPGISQVAAAAKGLAAADAYVAAQDWPGLSASEKSAVQDHLDAASTAARSAGSVAAA